MSATLPAEASPSRAQARGLTIRAKILAGFGGLILLMTLAMGITLYAMSNSERIAAQAIAQRQPAVHLLLRMSGELNLATALLNGYLLTGYQENEHEFLALQKSLQKNLRESKHLAALAGKDAQKKLAEVEKQLELLRQHGDTVIYLREHPEENYPGLSLARNTINGPANRFLGLNNILINADDLNLSLPDHRWFFYLLQELRYTWIQMMSNMRLFVTARGSGDLADFHTYLEQNGKILEELLALDMDIGFGELEEMAEIRADYVSKVPAVIELVQSKAWRADADFMRDEVRPVVEKLRQLLKGLADEQLDASIASGHALTQSLERVRFYSGAILLLAILGGLLIAISITRGIIPPIRRLVLAARQVADGDLNAEVFITSNDEVGQLGRSFNAMIDDLRAAALNEQQYTDELKALNQNLEKRVKLRTRELEHSEAKTRAILDNIGEGILTINAAGLVESLNPAAEQMFGYRKQEVIGINSALLLADEVTDGIADLDTYVDERDGVFRIRDSRQPVECLGKRADGSTFPMEFVVTSMDQGDNNLRICIVRDISARKQTEATLVEVQQQLVDAAHKSGMAEMATGVLHNIGNILNSVNLASEEIARIAGSSKVKGLVKANDLLVAHREDLAEFITRDGKGSKLPEYYIKLGGILAREIADIASEARSLSEKTNMMKEVIATQQAYARAGFHSEKLALDELTEDAIKIQQASLHKCGVKIHRRYAEIPPCLGQKSKLLQVLTNLIKNAKEAMIDNDLHNKPKLLGIETGLVNPDRCFIAISDNGCGIDEDQLARIFSHGFTTKRDGHGFGLHSSANAMTEMKGSLKVASPGPQQGATFTLTLPVHGATRGIKPEGEDADNRPTERENRLPENTGNGIQHAYPDRR